MGLGHAREREAAFSPGIFEGIVGWGGARGGEGQGIGQGLVGEQSRVDISFTIFGL